MNEAAEGGAAAAGRIEELIVLTERLTALIAEQAQAFEAGRPQDAATHLDEISLLANIYRKEAQAVRERPEPIAEAPRKDRLRLIRATEVCVQQAVARSAGPEHDGNACGDRGGDANQQQ